MISPTATTTFSYSIHATRRVHVSCVERIYLSIIIYLPVFLPYTNQDICTISVLSIYTLHRQTHVWMVIWTLNTWRRCLSARLCRYAYKQPSVFCAHRQGTNVRVILCEDTRTTQNSQLLTYEIIKDVFSLNRSLSGHTTIYKHTLLSFFKFRIRCCSIIIIVIIHRRLTV